MNRSRILHSRFAHHVPSLTKPSNRSILFRDLFMSIPLTPTRCPARKPALATGAGHPAKNGSSEKFVPAPPLFDELSKQTVSGLRLARATSSSQELLDSPRGGAGSPLPAVGQGLRAALRGLSAPAAALGVGYSLGPFQRSWRTFSRRDYGGAPVCLPWGPTPMGATPGPLRSLAGNTCSPTAGKAQGGIQLPKRQQGRSVL